MLAVACLQTGDLAAAREATEVGCRQDRKNYLPRIVLVGVHLTEGDSQQAKVALQETLRVKPDLTRDETMHAIGRELMIGVRKLRKELDEAMGGG